MGGQRRRIEVKPLPQSHLRHENEDRHEAVAESGRLREIIVAPARNHATLSHHHVAGRLGAVINKKTRLSPTIDEPQPAAGALFPLAGRDPRAALAAPGRFRGDRQPEAVFRADQRPSVMRADDLGRPRVDQRRRAHARLALGIGFVADRVRQPVAQPGAGDLPAPRRLETGAGAAHRGGHRPLAGPHLVGHQRREVAVDDDFQPHSGTSSIVQTSRSRSRRGLPWMR